ncbi:MAG: alkaline phosphatase family protein [Bacteroidetes bacterium]|nr:alkaline phosphatase family protein [Bacteroidota bacterium]
MIRKVSLALLIVFAYSTASAQKNKPNDAASSVYPKRPPLVVGVVVDQMRYDYLYRYWNQYGENGFKRLMNRGFLCKNANFNYVPTYTAPGHACIYTGTTPSVNGIVSNDWFDRTTKKSVYCVSDSTEKPVGTTSISGKMSPRQMLSTTMTDELRLATNFRSKVIGISLKDRGAILPAGHTANAAYWHDPYSNNWVTSTYYMQELPGWVAKFNDRKTVDSLLMNPWTTLLPLSEYKESSLDDNEYEGLFKGELKPVFPHNLPAIKALDSELIRRTPMGNTYTRLFAEAALDGEQLGKRGETDFLAVSFSSTDYVGHMYGINAIETEDTYLRLDREIEQFLNFLDARFGDSNYLLFLTADHGAAHNPEYSSDQKIPAGNMSDDRIADSLSEYIASVYGDTSIILSASSHNIYLNRELIEKKKLKLEEIQKSCARYVMNSKGVASALTASELARSVQRQGLAELIQNGFNDLRSADVNIQLQPGWLDWYTKTGTSHGTFYHYDTHVPVLFYGKGIAPGSTAREININDIAPTVCTFLNIESPSGCTGQPILELFK